MTGTMHFMLMAAVSGWALLAMVGCASTGADTGVTWVEGEAPATRTWLSGHAAGDKATASGGAVLYGMNLDAEGAKVTWNVDLPSPVDDAQLIVRYARLHWKQTMKTAEFTVTVKSSAGETERPLSCPDTKGWGNKPADWQLARTAIGNLPAGKLEIAITSMADDNSLSLDGFFIAPSEFVLTSAELDECSRIELSGGGYIGLRDDGTLVDQLRSPQLSIACRSFGGMAKPVKLSLTDHTGRVHRLKIASTDAPVTTFTLPNMPDGLYEMTASSGAPKVKLAASLQLAGQFIGGMEKALPQVEQFAAGMEKGGVDKRIAADIAHAVAYMQSGLASLQMQTGNTSAWAEHLAEAEAGGEPRNLIDNLASVLAQTQETIKRLKAGQDVYAGRTGDLRRAMIADVDGEQMIYRSFVPDSYAKAKSVPFILLLHGGGGDENYFPDMADGEILKILNQRGYVAASPRYHRRNMANWEEKLLQLIRDMQRDYPKIDAKRIYVTGISMGGGTTYRLATGHPKVFAGACCVSGSGSADDATKLDGMPMIILHGEADTVSDPQRSRDLAARLKQLGYPHELHTFVGQGHGYIPEVYLPLTLDFFEKHPR